MKMRTVSILSAAVFAAFSLAGIAHTQQARAQEVVRIGPDGPMVLMTPDGRLLDRAPEYGSVEVYFNRRGDRVLVDGAGRLVATEVPLDRIRGTRGELRDPNVTRLPRSRRNGSVERLDLPPSGGRNQAARRTQPFDTSSVPTIDAPQDDPGQPLTNQPPSNGRDAVSPLDDRPSAPGADLPKKDVAALQVLLDREGASPGVIDGRMGDNVEKALDAYGEITGQTLDASNAETIRRLLRENGGAPVKEYTITPEDAAGPYIASIPSDYAEKAKLNRLSFTTTAEMLAERFHMDENYLKALNPGVDFSVPGTTIKVTNTGSNSHARVTLVEADKGREQVRGYGPDGRLVVAYPATIGSTDTPSPSGTVSVERIAADPQYTYNPKINFTQGKNDKVLTIPPGPNGPVGSMWIALSKPTYGIHGTPAPSRIGKSNSHGCVRLTNWDAHELADMIEPGVTVKFVN